MIDPMVERLIPLRDAINYMPTFCRLRKPVREDAPRLWHVKGIAGATGQRVFLEALNSPGGRVTSVEAIARFLLRLSGIDSSPSHPPPGSKADRMRRRQAMLCRDLDTGTEVKS